MPTTRGRATGWAMWENLSKVFAGYTNQVFLHGIA